MQSEITKLNAVKDSLQKEIQALRVEMESYEQAAGGKQIKEFSIDLLNLVKVFSSDAIKQIQKENGSGPVEKEIVKAEPVQSKPDQPKQQKAPKKAEKTGESKKGAEKTADANETIDIGRLDLRVGRIVQIEKHP